MCVIIPYYICDCALSYMIVKVEPLHIASPNAQETMEDLMRKHHAGSIVARMERHVRRMIQVPVDKILHTMPVGKEFPGRRVGKGCHVMYKPERRHTAGPQPEAAHHSLFGSKGEFPLMYDTLELREVKRPVALHGDEVVPLAAMVAEEKVLAVCAFSEVVQRIPEGQPLLYGEERRMLYEPVGKAVCIEEGKDLPYAVRNWRTVWHGL